MRLALPPDARVSVRWVSTERFGDDHVAARAWAALEPGERIALARVHSRRARRDKLAAHALARTMLAERARCLPAEVRLRKSRLGRPVFVAPPGVEPAKFSIATSDGLAVCAVSTGCAVGADVESLANAGPDPLVVAADVCSPRELRRLLALPPKRRRAELVRIWTLKEAVLKARGVGLQVHPAHLTVDPVLRFDKSSSDDASRWRLVTACPTPRHVTAIALRRSHARMSRGRRGT